MRLLVTGAWSDAQAHLPQLQAMGHETVFLQQEGDALPCEPQWVEGVICNGLFLHHPIAQFSNLRYIQLTSAGFDRVPMAYIRQKGIEIHNAAGVYSAPMAEFAVSGVLQLYKQADFFRENQKAHKWEKHRGLRELTGQTVCILGCGSVGTACAKRFAAFDAHVIGVDLLPKENRFFEKIYPVEQLNEALPLADVVILTLPLTEQTRHMMNSDRLSRMKAGSVLVNIARGALVDTAALQAALQTHLSAAILDVFEEEPLPPESPLWDMQNVIITPHNSFVGDGNGKRLWQLIERNLEDRS